MERGKGERGKEEEELKHSLKKSYTDLCSVFHISMPLHEQADHFMSALEAGQGEGSVAIRLNLIDKNKR